MTRLNHPYVCPAGLASSLDNFLRRLVHKPSMILGPYIRDGMIVLDLGCGPGYFTAGLARLVGEKGRVIAADLQQKMLDKMQEKIRKAGYENRVEAHLCQPDTTDLSKKVDFILAFWMIHEVPDHDCLFRELKSILNQGGSILVAEPKIHVTRKMFSTMIDKARSAGFAIADGPKISISRSVVLTHFT